MATSAQERLGKLSWNLTDVYEKPVKEQLEHFKKSDFVKAFWQKDAKAWTSADEDKWLGWLDIVDQQKAQAQTFKSFYEEVKKSGYTHALLLGMGGSSLSVEVLRLTFGHVKGAPDMVVLDSTVPAQVLSTGKKVDLAKTIVIVASKSGSTTEPNVFCQYFYDEMKKAVGDKAGANFVAITDPGSSMEKRAKELGFGHTFFGLPSIGGRYSALSNFGMIPAAVMGLPVEAILNNADEMVRACKPGAEPADNPGLMLGTIIGVLARSGRDKLTMVTSPGFSSFGAWFEQLMAESTGKLGRGIVPVDAEPLAELSAYGKDRLFVYVHLTTDQDAATQAKLAELEKAGHPVVRIAVPSIEHIGAEFFRWEFATATAGAIIQINPFDQPNVQESKDFTKKFLAEYDEKGALPQADELVFEAGGIKLFADTANKEQLAKSGAKDLIGYLKAHLSRLGAGDYFAQNVYIEHNQEHTRVLQGLRELVLHRQHVATTLGFGPRFLHSTGQLHKGGPNSGVFLQITSDDAQDVPIPGDKYTFGVLKQAQALGDFVALSNRDRRLLRVHLPADVEAGLSKLQQSIKEALS
jgi:glucose-6-phosphate isomerase